MGKIWPAIVCLLLLSGCETPEETRARLTQHDGKTVDQVIAVLGSPISRTREQVVWERRDSYVVRHPEYERWNGQVILVGYSNQIVNQHCLFVGQLERNRIVSSSTKGNGCHKMITTPKPV